MTISDLLGKFGSPLGSRLRQVINGKRGISAGTALLLARYFTISAQFWLYLQTTDELGSCERVEATEIRREDRPLQHPSVSA